MKAILRFMSRCKNLKTTNSISFTIWFKHVYVCRSWQIDILLEEIKQIQRILFYRMVLTSWDLSTQRNNDVRRWC